jgi:molybdopterin-guanine dinucleotide biosynthesis protein A
MSMPQEITVSRERAVAILAGGQSRRMGHDKAQLRWGEASWLEHTARVALDASTNVAIVGRRRPLNWSLPTAVFLDDAIPDIGPMGGLVAALYWAKELNADSRVLALACDTPQLATDAVEWVFEQAAQRQLRDGLIVRNGGHIEPLFSIYTARCLPLLEQRLVSEEHSRGRFSLRAFIESAHFEYVDAPDTIAGMLHNFNTPEDVKALVAVPNGKQP